MTHSRKYASVNCYLLQEERRIKKIIKELEQKNGSTNKEVKDEWKYRLEYVQERIARLKEEVE